MPSYLSNLTKYLGSLPYKLVKDELSHAEWDSLMYSIEKPNLMQDWYYAEALRKLGWKIERYTVYFKDNLIAFFQVYKKQFLFFEFIRLQRGPLFLTENHQINHVPPILRMIRRRWNYWKGKTLLLSPELPSIPSNHEALTNMGFKCTQTLRWRSTLVDLSQNEDELIKKLDSNWRNHLKNALKNNLVLKETNEKVDFTWLIEQYEHFKTEKNFTGASKCLLEELYDIMIKQEKIQCLIALHNNEAIAGIITISYGRSNVYLLGWSGPLGRKFHAHNFLLWQAIKKAKLRDEIYFDLGGVLLEKKYESISRFKAGLNGEEYILIGDYY